MSDNPKRLWEAYSDLKTWSRTAQSSDILRVQGSSMEDSEMEASSAPPTGFVTITVLIYPSSEPFCRQGLPIEIQLPYTYPHQPPTVYLKIAMRHPNIDRDGE
jgi:ubiquitin-protein ligase